MWKKMRAFYQATRRECAGEQGEGDPMTEQERWLALWTAVRTLLAEKEKLLNRIEALRKGHQYWIDTDSKTFVKNHAALIIAADDDAAASGD